MSRTKLEDRLHELVHMNPAELVELWMKVADSTIPNVPVRLLRRFIAQRLQEKRHRGIPVLVERELESIAAGGAAVTSTSGPAPAVIIRPGTRLIREWNGQTISVIALEKGFEYEGKRYGSLTHIAREVTGTHQSGPRFFGLTKQSSARG